LEARFAVIKNWWLSLFQFPGTFQYYANNRFYDLTYLVRDYHYVFLRLSRLPKLTAPVKPAKTA